MATELNAYEVLQIPETATKAEVLTRCIMRLAILASLVRVPTRDFRGGSLENALEL
jgi:hypothetical protein